MGQSVVVDNRADARAVVDYIDGETTLRRELVKSAGITLNQHSP